MADKDNHQKEEVTEKKRKPNHGKNVKWFRKQKGYSQEYLATQIKCKEGVTQQTISEWEKEEVLPIEILEDIARILEVGVSWLEDSILDDESGFFSQDGDNNNNFQKNENVTFTVHNPLQAMERAYKDTMRKLTAAYTDAKDVYKENQDRTEEFYKYIIEEQKTQLNSLKIEVDNLRDKFIVIVTKIADKL